MNETFDVIWGEKKKKKLQTLSLNHLMIKSETESFEKNQNTMENQHVPKTVYVPVEPGSGIFHNEVVDAAKRPCAVIPHTGTAGTSLARPI